MLDNSPSISVAALSARLQQEGGEYRMTGPLTETQADFEFIGRFAGQPLVWQTRLLALGMHNGGEADRMQFIEIGSGEGERRELTVGLNLARIDPPAILKTIIMIRNYKRLREGRHEWWT